MLLFEEVPETRRLVPPAVEPEQRRVVVVVGWDRILGARYRPSWTITSAKKAFMQKIRVLKLISVCEAAGVRCEPQQYEDVRAYVRKLQLAEVALHQ